MRLISCHIENFGKLTDRAVSFEAPDGMKTICENNGWGKSTLATFIKAMFYGFDNEGRRSEIENERQHYRPWQGGVYGGQLTFEAGGRTYIISRTFGSKEKNDEFLLQDADTMLESTDYSSNIGEELFQIDRASFLRSIYISQNDCVTATTDQINAKLGNLTDNTNDLNNYESADRKINDMLNSLSGTRKTGILYKQKEQIAALRQEIKVGEAIDASMEELIRLKGDLHSSYKNLKEEQNVLQKKQKAISEYKDIAVKKKEYDNLCKQAGQKQAEFEQKKAFFPEKIPGADEVDEYIRLENITAGLKKELDIYKLEGSEESALVALEERFSLGVPDKADIEKHNIKVNEMQTLRRNIEKSMLTEDEQKSLQSLEELFADGTPTQEAIDELSNSWSIRTEKKNTLSSKRATADMLELTAEAARKEEAARKAEAARNAEAARCAEEAWNAKRTKAKRGRMLLTGLLIAAVGLIVAVAGVLTDFMLSLIAGGAIILIAGIAVMIISLFMKPGSTGKFPVMSGQDMADSDRADEDNAVSDKAFSDNIDQNMTDFDTADSDKPESNSTDSAPYSALRREIADDEELILRVESEVRQFLAEYGISFDENSIVASLYQLKENVKQYGWLSKKSQNADTERMQENYEALREDVEKFLQRYGFNAESFSTNSLDVQNFDKIFDTQSIYAKSFDMESLDTKSLHTMETMDSTDEMGKLAQYVNALHRLDNSVSRYILLKEKREKYKTAYEAHEKNTGLIKTFICGLKMEPAQDIHMQLQNIKDSLREHDNAWKEYEKAEKLKREFEERNADIEEIKSVEEREDDSSLTEIEARLSEISEELENNHTSMLSYDRRLDELQEKKDTIADFEKELEELQEQYARNEKKQKILKQTQQYLEQAKISLTAKYTKPIKEGFDKYFVLLSGIESEKYQLDANFDMSVMEQGMPRNIGFLSTGYQDMVGICMRMALIDAMYQEEKPFVIFDDPFVNLDGDKTDGALKMLNMIAKEYQVVYFTCNESRK